MKLDSVIWASFLFAVCRLAAQQLEPGAYSISPVGVNIVVLANTLNRGDLNFDPSGPISDASATINMSALAYVRTLNVAGRSANVGIVMPYAFGDLEGNYLGEFQQIRRSGRTDPLVRFAVNLYGAPAMRLAEFAKYRQRTNIGFSILLSAPRGQYDPAKLINIGQNRWAFKPEIGLSRAIGKWTLEVFGGAWFFTENNNFFNGRTRRQNPIGSGQFHVLYTFRRGLWAAFNSTFYSGGRTSINGAANFDFQRNSRIGATVAVPLNRRNSLKFSYSRGARTTIGGDFHSVTAAYQYLWGAGL